MNYSLRIFFFVLLFSPLTLALSSCSKNAPETIVGKWHVEGDPPECMTEFNKDGTFFAREKLLGSDQQPFITNVVSGNYSFIDSRHLKLIIDNPQGGGAPPILMTNKIRMKNDGMDVIEADSLFHLTRIK